MAVLKEFVVETIPVDEIVVVGTRRPINEGTVTSLVESIFGSEGQEGIGLQTPITIRSDQNITDPDTGEIVGGFALVAGRHRLEAYRRQGEARIPAIVRDCDKIDAEIWEIDENLMRSELTTEEKREHLRRRQEIWLKRRAEEEATGGKSFPTSLSDGRRAGPQHDKSFAAETAAATGLSKRRINQLLADPKPKPPREPLITKQDEPDMRVVAHKLATKHTVGELQDLIDHLTDILKDRMESAA